MPKELLNCDSCIKYNQSIFSVLTDEEKEILILGQTCHLYSKGETIFKEGDSPVGLICLSEGKVKVFKEGVGGRGQIVKMAKPVGFIGYRALFADEKHIATAVAIEESIICRIKKDTIFKLIDQNSKLAMSFLKSLAAELGFSNLRTVTLTQKHIRGRLAESLLFLKDTYGFEEDGNTIKVYLSREDVANLSSMTTSNAIRTLSNFAQEGVVKINGRRIKILDLSQLERISEIG